MGKDLLYWASTLLNLSRKGLESRDVLNQHGNNSYLEADLINYMVFPPTYNQILQEISKMERFIEEDNRIRYSFGIDKQLIR